MLLVNAGKPTLLAFNVYVPDGRAEKIYSPSAPEVVDRPEWLS